MCGIAGFFGVPKGAETNLAATADRMGAALRHRGPDSGGVWVHAEAGVALAHRRLSILDLSSAGDQPMASASGRFVMAFNGEIYNHAAMRAELQADGAAPAWRGHSDTETLLAAIDAWGIEGALTRAVGMFAIALWDRSARRLVLARDRLGEKPLYYGWIGGPGQQVFAFGSELKALRAYPTFANPISVDALALYLQYGNVPAPLSIYQDVYKLEPGCTLAVDRPDFAAGPLQSTPYWRATQAAACGAADPITDDAAAVDSLERTLTQAVAAQMVADVPLGVFLSGGVDSSTIAALMQAGSARPVQTFTVGFDQKGFDEAPFARAVAEHLGTQHHELRVTADDARALIPALPTLYDEPFADSSQIPTYFICKAARQHVTVALSGDGADELFGGYNRYVWAGRVSASLGWLPATARQGLGAALRWLPTTAWDVIGNGAKITRLAEKVHKLANRIGMAHNIDDLYQSLVTEWPPELGLALGARAGQPRGGRLGALALDPAQQMMLWDTLTYLPDDILTKVDRAAMAVSLETRAPFLDHRVVELAWRLPLQMKIRNGETKWALRQVLDRHVPRALIERPKAGFAVPIGDWLRGPLRNWAEELLDEARLQREGYLNAGPIREAWRQHLTGRFDWTARLWTVLMFQAWLEDLS